MPITQNRILKLLDEAEGFRDTFDKLIERTRFYILQTRKGEVKDMYELVAMLEGETLVIPRPPSDRMTLERYHFKVFDKRNTRERNRARSKSMSRAFEMETQTASNTDPRWKPIIPEAEHAKADEVAPISVPKGFPAPVKLTPEQKEAARLRLEASNARIDKMGENPFLQEDEPAWTFEYLDSIPSEQRTPEQQECWDRLFEDEVFNDSEARKQLAKETTMQLIGANETGKKQETGE